jgi:hypothetical protein
MPQHMSQLLVQHVVEQPPVEQPHAQQPPPVEQAIEMDMPPPPVQNLKQKDKVLYIYLFFN